MSLNRYTTRMEFLRVAGLLGIYLCILTSSIGCLFKRASEDSTAEETDVTLAEEVNPTPTLVEQSPITPSDEETFSPSTEQLVEAKYYQTLGTISVRLNRLINGFGWNKV